MSAHRVWIGLMGMALASRVIGGVPEAAEVRMPYEELKRLMEKAAAVEVPAAPPPALLGVKLRVEVVEGLPQLSGVFRVAAFDDRPALVPLLGGAVAVGGQDPADEVVVMEKGQLSLWVRQAGVRELKLKMLPVSAMGDFQVKLPECPAMAIEVGELPEGRAVELTDSGVRDVVGAGKTRAVASGARTIGIRLLDPSEAEGAMRPPEPSNWKWQQEAVVLPEEGLLIYQILARATASEGAGLEALLSMPPEAVDVKVSGDDLASAVRVPMEGRGHVMQLKWAQRGKLDRVVRVSYQLPLRPLDRVWSLQAPGGMDARTRFLIATAAGMEYAADGLSGAFEATGLPASLAEALKGRTCRHLEGGNTVELKVAWMPVVATATAVVNECRWQTQLETDGAIMTRGQLDVVNQGASEFILDTPAGMKLLSCEVEGKREAPVDLGGGRMKLNLPAGSGTQISCSFTGRLDALDPVEGTCHLELPQTPLFVNLLRWEIQLPEAYQAETHGNLTRVVEPKDRPTLVLCKKLCRDERPAVHVFYQRTDLDR